MQRTTEVLLQVNLDPDSKIDNLPKPIIKCGLFQFSCC